jgi:hypothetical protein
MKTIIPTILTAALLAGAASAQTKPTASGLARVQPVAASATACTTGLIEIAPVSFDTGGKATAYVVVHRVNGEVVAAERVTPQEIEQLHRAPCKADGWGGAQLAG